MPSAATIAAARLAVRTCEEFNAARTVTAPPSSRVRTLSSKKAVVSVSRAVVPIELVVEFFPFQGFRFIARQFGHYAPRRTGALAGLRVAGHSQQSRTGRTPSASRLRPISASRPITISSARDGTLPACAHFRDVMMTLTSAVNALPSYGLA